MKNEAGNHIKEFYFEPNGKRAYHPKAQLLNEDDAKEAVNLALEQVGKEAVEKSFYSLGVPKAINVKDLDKIIKTLKL